MRQLGNFNLRILRGVINQCAVNIEVRLLLSQQIVEWEFLFECQRLADDPGVAATTENIFTVVTQQVVLSLPVGGKHDAAAKLERPVLPLPHVPVHTCWLLASGLSIAGTI